MKILVRIYIPQKDKANIDVKTLDEAYLLLGVKEGDEKQRVKWCSFEDIYFKNTKDYIRINYG